MNEAIKGNTPTTIDMLIQRIDHPFTLEVMDQPLPGKFKPPQMEMFDGTQDPLDHLKADEMHINLQAAPNEIMC